MNKNERFHNTRGVFNVYVIIVFIINKIIMMTVMVIMIIIKKIMKILKTVMKITIMIIKVINTFLVLRGYLFSFIPLLHLNTAHTLPSHPVSFCAFCREVTFGNREDSKALMLTC